MPTSTYEYAFVWLGSDNGRPWGTKAEGYTAAAHLNLGPNGIALQNVVIAAGENTGTGKTLSVGTTLVADQWVGAQFRPGTTAAPLGGYATVTANTTNSITVDWASTNGNPGTGTVQGYLVRTDGLWASYPDVRVLVPYQPEGPDTATSSVSYPAGTPIAPPGYTMPAGVTTHTDWGVFLPLSFGEGIASHGISEGTDSYTSPATHAVQAVDAGGTYIDYENPAVESALAGGYIVVEWLQGGTTRKVSWSQIGDQDNTVAAPNARLTGLSWTGGTPELANIQNFHAFVPHYDNSPHAYTPGPGFRYPGNDMQPCSEGDGRILNLPRGITTTSYGDRFGPIAEFGWRMSSAIGRRVNIIHLSVNSSSLVPRTGENLDGFAGTLGWWDHTKHGDWVLTSSDGLAARLETMIQTIAPNALLAESNTRPMRILGIIINTGYEDIQTSGGRENYARVLKQMVAWVREACATYSPYADEAEIPVLHPGMPSSPWQDSGGLDEDGLINAAIAEVLAADQFGGVVNTDDSDQLTGDAGHFDGAGEALNGELIASVLGDLVDDALEFGSEVLSTTDDGPVDISNLALSHIGEESAITSLDTSVDTSEQARLCALFYPKARDAILEMRQWQFAMRRTVMQKSAVTPDPWQYAYVVPADALLPIAVLPPGVVEDYVYEGSDMPVDFNIEQAGAGHRVLYTDMDEAVLRYVGRVVDTDRYPESFKLAVSWYMASLLAGPIIKGVDGAAMAREAIRMTGHYVGLASVNQGKQRQSRLSGHKAPWHRVRTTSSPSSISAVTNWTPFPDNAP